MSAPDEPRGHEWNHAALVAGALIVVIALALLYGARVGSSRSQREAEDDPVAPFLTELHALTRDVDRLAPSLLGYSPRLPAPDLGPIEGFEARLADLRKRASEKAIPLDSSQLKATLNRARFERAFRLGDLQRAEELLKSIGGNEQHLLEVRLKWRRGHPPDPAWLEAWIESPDDDMAQAARVLLARRIGPEDPQRALEVLAARVHPLLAKPERARVALLQAVDRLEPHVVSSRLREAGGELRFPRARARTVARAIELTNDPNASPEDLIRALRVIGLLGGEQPPRGRALARAALGVARLLEARIRPDDAKGWRGKQLVNLLDALGRSGLRPGVLKGSIGDGPLLADGLLQLTRRELLPPGLYAKALLACVRLDVPLEATHLRGARPQAIEALPPSGGAELLRLRVALATTPDAKQRAPLTTELSGWLTTPAAKELGPQQRARALLEALPARPPLDQRKAAQEAVRLAPESPLAHLALAEALIAPTERREAEHQAGLAVEALDRLVAARPVLEDERPDVLRRASKVYARLGKAERAGSLRQAAEK